MYEYAINITPFKNYYLFEKHSNNQIYIYRNLYLKFSLLIIFELVNLFFHSED